MTEICFRQEAAGIISSNRLLLVAGAREQTKHNVVNKRLPFARQIRRGPHCGVGRLVDAHLTGQGRWALNQAIQLRGKKRQGVSMRGFHEPA